MPNTVKVFRVAKANDVYQGPVTQSYPTAWELDVVLMDLEAVRPKESNWLYGFTEEQMNLVLNSRIMKKLNAQGFALFVFELPVDAVEIFRDQVCFNPDIMNDIYQYQYDIVG